MRWIMKKVITIISVAALIVLTTMSLHAQTAASATWQLIANQQATIAGNVVADSVIGHTLVVKDYTGASMGGPLGAAQARWNRGGVNWPGSTAQENNIYMDFVVSPKPGYNFTVDSVKGSFGGGGTSNMKANLLFGSADTSLASLTALNTSPLPLRQASYFTFNPADTNVSYYVGLEVKNGAKFRLRVYAWNQTSSASATKYIYTQNIIIKGTTTPASAVEGETEIPANFKLEQNYPNPFNPTTSISYSIPKTAFVTLKVYNLIGQEVASLVNEIKDPGNYKSTFDASKLSSGIYFYRLEAGNFVSIKKMALMK